MVARRYHRAPARLHRAIRLALLLAFLFLLPVPLLRAQGSGVLDGRVVLGQDSAPVSGVSVVLHRVTPDTGFAVDSARTDDAGRFRFRLPADAVETERVQTVHLVAARYRGVLYYGPAVHGGRVPSPYRIVVHASRAAETADSLAVSSRTLVLTRTGGTVEVMDVVDVRSPAEQTLVAPDPGGPFWGVSLPDGAEDPRALPGGLRSADVVFEEGAARSATAVPPEGQRIVLGYRMAAGRRFSLTLSHSVSRLEVVVDPGSRGLEGVRGLGDPEPVQFEDRRFQRYSARDLAAGEEITFRLRGGSGGPSALPWILMAAGVVLSVGAVLAFRRSGAREGGGSTGSP